MHALSLPFLIVAVILFILAAIPFPPPANAWHGPLLALGLAFFAAGFAVASVP